MSYENWNGNTMQMGMDDSWHNAGADPMFDDPADYKSGAKTTDYGQAMGSVAGLVTGYLGMRASDLDIERQNEATMRNLESLGEAGEIDNANRMLQSDRLAEMTADALTAEGLKTLKLESSARATAAESGSTTMADDLVNEVHSESSFRKAAISREYENAAEDILIDSQTDLWNYEQRVEAMLFNMQTPTEAALQTATAGLNATTSGMRIGSIIGSF